jgi:iron(III) transport system substrate-binding protein
MFRTRTCVVRCAWALLLAACTSKDVVLYVSVDQEHSEELVHRFAAETGLAIRARYDTEASKTVGLVSALLEERERPRCDVFWNNELAQTVRLQQQGMLVPYASPSGATIPSQWKDAHGNWYAFGARARIILVNTQLLPDRAQWPRRTFDLVDPKWQGRCGIARPLSGTTLTHFAALRIVLGKQRFEQLLDGIFANKVELLQGNSAAMKGVAEGRLAWAFADTDDANVALRKGQPVAIVFPDQEAGGIGAMLIPNTVAIIAGCPHPAAARRLVDWLLAERVEGFLAAGPSAQIPLRAGIPGPPEPSILPIAKLHVMDWDPVQVAASLDAASAGFARRF